MSNSYTQNTENKKSKKSKKTTNPTVDVTTEEINTQLVDLIFPDGEWEINKDIDEKEVLQLNNNNENSDAKPSVDEFGNEQIIVMKKKTYTQAHRLAQQRYRERYPEKYCELQRKLYNNKKQDDEWKKKFNERSKINNEKWRIRNKEKQLAEGIQPKPRGRPRKVEKTNDETSHRITIKDIIKKEIEI